MSSDALCRCGHPHRNHGVRCGTPVGPWLDVSDYPNACDCRSFDDSRLPDPGGRLMFGVHRQPSDNAETAEAWPTLPSWSARVTARTTRALRRLR